VREVPGVRLSAHVVPARHLARAPFLLDDDLQGVVGTVQHLRRSLFVLGALGILSACQTPGQKKAAERAAINQQAGAEITRICALQGAEREAELKKLKAASGMDLYCPNP
jgi:hypothetical protein